MPSYDQCTDQAPTRPVPAPICAPERDDQDLLGNSALLAQMSDQPTSAIAPRPGEGQDFSTTGAVIGGALGGVLLGPLGAIGGSLLGGWLGGDEEQAPAQAPTQAPTQTPTQAPTQTPTQGQTPGQQRGPVSAGLGTDIDDLMRRSPTLSNNISTLQANGWTIRYGQAGAGTVTDSTTHTITVDPNESANPATVVQSLAHETGHALYTPDAYVDMPGHNRDQYVDTNVQRDLRNEGEATIMNLQVREELMAGAHPTDIGVAGAQSAQYIQLYDQWRQSGSQDRNALRQQIGQVYATGEHPSNDVNQTYYDYYARTYRDFWDQHHTTP